MGATASTSLEEADVSYVVRYLPICKQVYSVMAGMMGRDENGNAFLVETEGGPGHLVGQIGGRSDLFIGILDFSENMDDLSKSARQEAIAELKNAGPEELFFTGLLTSKLDESTKEVPLVGKRLTGAAIFRNCPEHLAQSTGRVGEDYVANVVLSGAATRVSNDLVSIWVSIPTPFFTALLAVNEAVLLRIYLPQAGQWFYLNLNNAVISDCLGKKEVA